jgi:hypothetical protein
MGKLRLEVSLHTIWAHPPFSLATLSLVLSGDQANTLSCKSSPPCTRLGTPPWPLCAWHHSLRRVVISFFLRRRRVAGTVWAALVTEWRSCCQATAGGGGGGARREGTGATKPDFPLLQVRKGPGVQVS